MSNNTTIPSKPGCYTTWLVVLPISTSQIPFYGVLAAIHIIFQLVSTTLNVLVVKAIIILRSKNHARSHMVSLNLCLTDLAYNLTTELAYIILLIIQLRDIANCHLVTFIGISGLFLCFASFLLLLFTTLERYIAVFHPFNYHSCFSSRLLTICMIAVYFVAACATMVFRISRFQFAAGLSLLILIMIGGSVMVVAFVRIFRFVYQTQSQLRSQRVASIADSTVGESSNTAEKNKRARQRDQGYANLIASLLSFMLICYLPYLIAISLFFFAKSVHVSKGLLHWLWALLLINATLNPICFCFFDKEIRHEIAKDFQKKQN